MSLIIVRMKMASSQTRTVWLTARSLSSQNRAQQRRDIQHDEQFTIPPAHGPHQRGIYARETFAVFERGFARGHHINQFVNAKADQPPRTVTRVTSHFEDNKRSDNGFG